MLPRRRAEAYGIRRRRAGCGRETIRDGRGVCHKHLEVAGANIAECVRGNIVDESESVALTTTRWGARGCLAYVSRARVSRATCHFSRWVSVKQSRTTTNLGHMPTLSPVGEVVAFFSTAPSREDIAAFQLSESAVERLRDLLRKNARGELTAFEERELDQMVLLDDIVSLIKANVRSNQAANSADANDQPAEA